MPYLLRRLRRPFSGWLQWHQITTQDNCSDFDEFFEGSRGLVKDLFSHLVDTLQSFKYQLKVRINFVKDVAGADGSAQTSDGYFSHNMSLILHQGDIDATLENAKAEIQSNIDAFESRGSGWVLERVQLMDAHISRYRPLRASSFLPTPLPLAKSRAIVNPKNVDDEKCFLYCILAALYPNQDHPERVTKWKNFNHNLSTGMLRFPVSLDDISLFELENNLSINVYVYTHNHIQPLQISTTQYDNINDFTPVDLLLLEDGNIRHFCLIRSLDKLLFHQTRGKSRKFFCRRCFSCFKSSRTRAQHLLQCRSIQVVTIGRVPQNVEPRETSSNNRGDQIVQFKAFQKTQWRPLIMYADFECLIEKLNTLEPSNHDISFIQRQHIHTPCGFGIQAVFRCCDNSNPIYEEPIVYRGLNPVVEFVDCILKRAQSYQNHVDHRDKSIQMTKHDYKLFHSSTSCYICQQPFEPCANCADFVNTTNPRCHMCREAKRRDHCHFCSVFKGAAHNSCNLYCKVSRDVVVAMHNGRRYDWHLLMQKIGRIAHDKSLKLEVIAKSDEDYIGINIILFHQHSFAIDLKTARPLTFSWKIRFIDTFQFLSSSLANLTINLLDKGMINFVALRAVFLDETESKLLTKKGIYPYSYMNCWDRFDEPCLPPIKEFYNDLTASDLSQEDYDHAQNVYFTMKCQNLGEYHDLYLLTDTLLLADIFENFRSFSKAHFSLDPANYLTLPSFGWDACLKLTAIKLELLTDLSMYEFFEKGIRGGISVITHRFAKANNRYVESNYNSNEPHTYLIYLDANNLYGYSMIQFLPTHSFEWLSKTEIQFFDLKKLCVDDTVGYVLEVDIDYPDCLHDEHNDYPLAPEKLKLDEDSLSPYCQKLRNRMGVKSVFTEKLVPNLRSKTNYIVHGKNLQLYMQLGLVVTKINRVLAFGQSTWMQKYIEFNTEMRKKAKSSFEKDLFKLLNNSVFGKSMENVRKYIDVRIVTNQESLRKMIASPRYDGFVAFDEHLMAVKMKRIGVRLNKPIYTGFTVLELSKHLMYSFHYNHIKAEFGSRAKLLFSDTDSLCYSIMTEDIYDDMLKHLDTYDTSDYPREHILYSEQNKKVMGKMKDETMSIPIREFVGLRPKMYSMIYGNTEKKTAKGVTKAVVKKQITHNDYSKVLFQTSSTKHTMIQLRSQLHQMYTMKLQKTTLSAYDDKRFILEDGITSYAYGHYRIGLFGANI